MNYGNAVAGAVATNPIRGGSDPKSMDALLSDLDKRLAGVREGINRVSEFRHRLLNPRPEDTSQETPPEPNPVTVEGRLSAYVRYADRLAQDLHEICSELERAA